MTISTKSREAFQGFIQLLQTVDCTESMIMLGKVVTTEILYVNNFLCEKLGYTWEELLTMKVTNVDKSYINSRYKVVEEL